MLEPPEAEPAKILLVDDQASNLRYLSHVLTQPGYDIIVATSGPQALELVAKHEFAVVLLDVAMPGMDGFEVATRMQQAQPERLTPIVFVTASGENIEWLSKAYQVGGVDFLAKPLDRHIVRAKVAVFVELFRQRKQLQRQALRLRDAERTARALEGARVKLEHDRRYHHLAESLPNVIWMARLDGRVDYVNRRWHDATARTAEACLGHGWLAAVHVEDRALVMEKWRLAGQTGSELEVECRLESPSGAFRWHLCRALPEQEGGRTVRWFGSFTDVDEQKQAHEQARRAISLRDDFISIASHELRTPMTALKLQLDLLRKRDLAGRAEHTGAVSLLDRQLDRLMVLVESLLDVSRITAGQLILHRVSYDLMDAVARLVQDFTASAASAGCDLRLSGRGATHVVQWDRTRIDQAIGNLLSNAIKYAPKQPIDLAIDDVDDQVTVSVRDLGIGIGQEHLGRIFQRFERAAPAANYGGLGLGLWLSSQIVEAHGGTIDVASDLGIGSVFTIRLPRAAPRARGNASGRSRGAAPS